MRPSITLTWDYVERESAETSNLTYSIKEELEVSYQEYRNQPIKRKLYDLLCHAINPLRRQNMSHVARTEVISTSLFILFHLLSSPFISFHLPTLLVLASKFIGFKCEFFIPMRSARHEIHLPLITIITETIDCLCSSSNPSCTQASRAQQHVALRRFLSTSCQINLVKTYIP